jgi:hypothetical protein
MALASDGVSFRKHDADLTEGFDAKEMPKYIDDQQGGDRELYKGDYTGKGRPDDPNGPDKDKDPLSDEGGGAFTKIYVVVQPGANLPGGWGIYTAWPVA